MRKFLFSIAIASVLISCGKSIESDAKKMADLMCKAQEDKSNSIENLKYVEQIEKIEEKYEGEEKEKLQKLAEDLYLKQCGGKISSSLFDSKPSEEESLQEGDQILSSDPTLAANSNFSDNDFDKMLDNYENYIDQYLVLYQKAMNGDQTAMMEYPSLMEKAQELEKSMKDAQDNNKLTVQQAKRMNDINFKMLEAMQNQGAGY